MRIQSYCILAALAASCAAPPPFRVETEHGVVRARDVETAQSLAHALAVAPTVRATLASSRAERPIVWVLEAPRDPATQSIALCTPERILLYGEAMPFAAHILAHELAHWYVRGSPYQGVPSFVEEGLVETVAFRITGWNRGIVPAHALDRDIVVQPAALFADSRRWMKLPAEQRSAAERLGFEVADRLGLEGLRALAAAGAGPMRYLEQAGLTPRLRAGQPSTGGSVEVVWSGADGVELEEQLLGVDTSGAFSAQVPAGAVRLWARLTTGAVPP